ncbi:hypothetical protein C3731_17030 [Brucella oryzae]|uniref:Uncharacterized protein n=1 Tax=Brucella oryzae TaxID=335286 RepID=A0A2S7IWN8_9HYPH|nr:hypothetical protein C3731_17030 [Brucella oryzae]
MGLSHRRSSFYSLAACSRLAAFIMPRPSAVPRAHEPLDRIDRKGPYANFPERPFGVVTDTRRS